ncbi:hypothetical protein AM501_19420 [Aneurinibacillus migulanus]|uniref:Predicted nucleotidyltransferase n=1 Tax=Aneurinibacillus migulanus TaxID=47500 RepID=A0A0D1XI34_ANEMI|nr:nucleotidyltransferase domain-containing protein [Aneurinibacillus migulanus]KIV51913.1 hypothetical protein TS65_25470 [Aneurinibacillus migulanus]KIV54395.1 hypothetical protein TS64_15180 [Aneurinibacillus migulanus]KON98034.1 hypothetical protein AF333_23945 [Aneurinibacillus migulanus]KPD06790.1 hypothetical protein AM501_19420 [Aneurinibacillus migulanus]MCP1354205.1 nucleotidyltransferase domain-containing protein [Aneurinibacillus migulanus]
MSKLNYDYNTLSGNTIYEVITGSQSYGLNTDNSDIDIKGIVILPKELFFSMTNEWETEVFHDPDIEYHSLKKFMNLANSQNPTVLEMLYTESQFINKSTSASEKLRENRHLFLSQNCFFAFGGYAQQQLMKIKNGLEKATDDDRNKHLRYTVENIIRRFSERYPTYNNDNIKVLDIHYDEDGKQQMYLSVHFDNTPITQLSGMVSEIQNAYKGYTKIGNRNRKPEQKLGKHAMHLIRLLTTGIEVLEQQTIQVYRSEDRDFLLSLRNGDYEWDEVFKMIDELELKLQQAFKYTKLPKVTDWNKINNLYKEIMLEHF